MEGKEPQKAHDRPKNTSKGKGLSLCMVPLDFLLLEANYSSLSGV